MKNTIIISTFLLLLTISCHKKSDITRTLPSIIEQKIQAFASSQSNCADANVKEYNYQQQLVYVFDHGTCIADGQQIVLNIKGEEIGALGGISGNSIINGGNFNTATFIQIVWKK